MKGIRSNTELNAAVDKIAHRKASGRVSSNAPPSPAPKGPGSSKVVKDKPVKTKIPAPAKPSGSVDTGPTTPATAQIVHNHYYK